MTLEEIGQFLGRVGLGDNRQIGTAQIMDWEDNLPAWITFEEALAALKHHRRTSTDYLMPVHIIRFCEEAREAVRRERLRTAPVADIPGDLHQAQERAWMRAFHDAVKSGEPNPNRSADERLGLVRPELPPADLDRLKALLSTSKRVQS